MSIDDVRARLEDGHARMVRMRVGSAQGVDRDDLRALLDDHARLAACDEGERHEITRLRAEVERLTRERDAAESSLGAAHTTLAEAYRLRDDRDRLAATLAEVREAVRRVLVSHPSPRIVSKGEAAAEDGLRAVLAAAPADLAAAHDARVRAEALREAAAAVRMERDWHMDIHAECEAWLRSRADAEAERIGGGR